MKRVAVIGAGPCGLGVLRAFAAGGGGAEVVCFEKQDDWGGLWNYSWRVGVDQNGETEHGSMYRFLWSNGPKECLEFADYTFDEHFKKAIPSFPPREVLYDYIIGRAKQSDVRKLIRFQSIVRSVTYSDKTEKFTVAVYDAGKGSVTSEEFDHVVVCSGHFSSPMLPHYDGMERFPGRILHSHDFRDAQEFTGRNVLVIGSSYSAEDIALQCKKYGAATVTVSYRTAAMGFKWPDGIREVPQLTKLEGKTAHFKDGDKAEDIDAIILCTGYRHHFPYMEDSLTLKTHNRLYPPNLYKGVLWRNNPRLSYIGMQDQYYTFNMFDAQAWYVRDVILGKIALPSEADMDKDISEWSKREEALSNPFEDIDFQTDYTRDLCSATDYPKIDLDLISEMFKKWEHDKEDSIIGYRNNAFRSPCTGTEAPVHHTPWWDAKDDSMSDFLR